ncbi:MAG: type II toxin-antitoxin system VapC family toxin [Ectothiorhodospiraceae bacterium]
MLVDTDVLIWNFRGNERAAQSLDQSRAISLSAVTYMELLQGLRDQSEFRQLRQAIRYWQADILHLDHDISSRAMYLVETYSLSHGLQMADALVASTALSAGLPLFTANDKHYRFIDGLEITIFRP